jgi:protein-S-isoprenylcysteine O-methyltransferase Ste14
MGTHTNQLNDREPGRAAGFSMTKVIIRFVLFNIIMAVILFVAGGSIRWLGGWLWLVSFTLLSLISTLVVPFDQEMIEGRTSIKPDVKTWDKWLVIVLNSMMPLGQIILAGLDHRFKWSGSVSLWLMIAATLVGSLFYGMSVWAAAVNKFYERFVRIQKERGHRPITGGPYRIVRHPGYLGLLVWLALMPLMLNTFWLYVMNGLMMVGLIVRTALEDRTLRAELDGYEAYAHQTRYRLIPGIW